MIIIISTAIVVILAIAIRLFFFEEPKEITKEDFLVLIEKPYSVNDFKQLEKKGELIISGELNKEDIISLSKEISKKINLNIVEILIFKDKVNEIENGFYVDGLTNEVTIRNKSKSIKISEFKEYKINTSVKDITLADGEYKDVKNIDGIVYIDITSNTLSEDKLKEELYLLAKIINNSNENLKNVIITATINDITYGISLNNPDIIKTVENHNL